MGPGPRDSFAEVPQTPREGSDAAWAPRLVSEPRASLGSMGEHNLDLNAIKSRIAAATPGPCLTRDQKATASREDAPVAFVLDGADAAFIASARTDLVALAQRVEALEARLAARGTLNRMTPGAVPGPTADTELEVDELARTAEMGLAVLLDSVEARARHDRNNLIVEVRRLRAALAAQSEEQLP
jgi:hypothetical protein